MDDKKNLNPELKAIYDRVMNTQMGSPTHSTPPLPTTPTGPAPTPVGAVPPPPPAHTAAVNVTPSLAPKPIDGGGKPYVFTAGKKIGGDSHAGGGKKVPMPLIAGGIVIFLIVYAIGWMKFFKIF